MGDRLEAPPPQDICWRQACGWTAKEELDDSILCLFESIFEEIYRRPDAAFPLSADILSAWIKPTLILKVTGKKTTHSSLIYLNMAYFKICLCVVFHSK